MIRDFSCRCLRDKTIHLHLCRCLIEQNTQDRGALFAIASASDAVGGLAAATWAGCPAATLQGAPYLRKVVAQNVSIAP